MKKKLLGVVLVMAMLLSLAPTGPSALADEAASAGGTVVEETTPPPRGRHDG